jgi:hypothetical protein
MYCIEPLPLTLIGIDAQWRRCGVRSLSSTTVETSKSNENRTSNPAKARKRCRYDGSNRVIETDGSIEPQCIVLDVLGSLLSIDA